MTLNELTTILSSAISGEGVQKVMSLDQHLFSQLPIAQTVIGYFGESTLQINRASLSVSSYDVTVTGVATVLQGPYTLTLTGFIVANQPQLQLTALPVDFSSWNFGACFGTLPAYEGTDRGLVVQKPSFFNETVIKSPLFTAATIASGQLEQGLNFSGILDATQGPIGISTLFIPGSNKLNMSGTIQLINTTKTVIKLKAPVNQLIFNVGEALMNDVYIFLGTRYAVTADQTDLSVAELCGTLPVGSSALVKIEVITSILQNGYVWTFGFRSSGTKLKLSDGLDQLSQLVSGQSLPLPSSLGNIFDPCIDEINVGISTADLTVEFISIVVGVDNPWTPPIPKIKLTKVQLTWTIFPGSEIMAMTGSVLGEFAIGDTAPVTLLASASYPDYVITAQMKPGDKISVLGLLNYLIGGGYEFDTTLVINDIGFQAYLEDGIYNAYCEVETQWTIPLLPVTLTSINVKTNYFPDDISAYLYARFTISDVDFYVSANHPGADKGWMFSGGMLPGEELPIGTLLEHFALNFNLPASLNTIKFTQLNASFNTFNSTYSFDTRIRWAFELFNYDFTLDALFNIKSDRQKITDLPTYSGQVGGSLMVNNFFVGVVYIFDSISQTIQFKLKYKQLELIASLIRQTKPGPPIQEIRLLKINFGDLSLGDIVAYLASFANPNADVKLDSPWDVLYSINFKNLSLTVNLDTKAVSIDYRVDLNLVFASIDTIGLEYVKEKGKGKLNVKITGSLLDQKYDDANPLKWDMINDPPPAVPGKQSSFIDIKYVGIGQHVSLANVRDFNTVEEVIGALKQNMREVKDKDVNPLSQQHGLKFDENSHWLFGLDVTVLDTVGISVVFNDPYLYGLLIALTGEKAGALAGLKFEVLYVKITDDIGVFKIELRVPDQFRQLEFGAVSVTLPVIRLEIYTNGNFRVDLGFPRNADFSVSFCVQVFPFIGYGGFYFAYLTGATSKRVPQISNGVFNPVIELGLGLSVGLGKTFSKGPLKAGLSVTVVGIMEGTLAWFHPDNKSLPDPMYYWMQGTIAIVGKLYGEVDFKIIKVSVSVEAYASATLIIEAYQPIQIELKVGVEVSASVTIIFVTVHFNFHLELHESFTIGHATTPPWIVGPRNPGGLPGQANGLLTSSTHRGVVTRQLRMQRPAVVSRPKGKAVAKTKMEAASYLRFAVAKNTLSESVTQWNTSLAFDVKMDLSLNMMPAITVAQPSSLIGGDGDTPQIEIVMTLFAQNTISPGAEDAKAARNVHTSHLTGAVPPLEAPFNLIVQGMLLYVIRTYQGVSTNLISLTDLQLIYKLLGGQDAEHNGFSYANLVAFIGNNFDVQISGLAKETLPDIPLNGQDPQPPANTSGTVFPMIPELSMLYPSLTIAVNFKTNNQVSLAYEHDITTYFEKLAVDYLSNVADDPFNVPQASTSNASDSESMATLIFRDYFLMIAKGAVQEAIDILSSYTYQATSVDCLFSIANAPVFPKVPLEYEVDAGETLHNIAQHFSMTDEKIAELNPGVPLNTPLEPPLQVHVLHGVTVAEIAEANKDAALQEDSKFDIDTVLYQVTTGDNQGTIESLADIATRFGFTSADQVVGPNASHAILKQSESFDITSQVNGQPQGYFNYSSQAGDNLNFIASYFFARNEQKANEAELSWYIQTISNFNPGVEFGAASGPSAYTVLPVGTSLKVPVAWLNSDISAAITYTSRKGDMLDWIARYFVWVQNPGSALLQFANEIKTLNPIVNFDNLTPGEIIRIPKITHTIQGTDTFDSLAGAFNVTVIDLSIANKDHNRLLDTLAVLIIKNVSHTVGTGESLSSLANTYNLTVKELAGFIEKVTGLFAGPLTIPEVPQYLSSALVTEVINSGAGNKIAAMVSRFLVHGLRLPYVNDQSKLYAIYDQTGQQFAGPSASITNPFDIVFSNTDDVAWLKFADSYVIQQGDTVALLESKFPSIRTLNPYITWTDPLTAGWVVLTQISPSLDISLTPSFIGQHYPSSTTFSPQFSQAVAMKLFRDHPQRYSLQKHLHWQAFSLPVLPNPDNKPLPKAGEPGIWLFPESLIDKARSGSADNLNFELCIFDPKITDDAYPKVHLFEWATLVEFQVRRVEDPAKPGQYLADTFEIAGAPDGERDRLLDFWKYLDTTPTEGTPVLSLLYPPNASSGNPSGLLSDLIDQDATFILKTNLSTTTTSGAINSAAMINDTTASPSAAGTYYSPINDPKVFLLFLWESWITGTGGYYLHYRNNEGDGLPADIFDSSGQANLWLLLALNSQSRQSADRKLHSFNNCAVIGDNLDPALTNVFAQANTAQLTPANMNRVSTVPPGNVGFELTRSVPGAGALIDSLYNLLGYSVKGDALFTKSNKGMPVAPAKPSDGTNSWYYHQVLAVSNFGSSDAPACDALPHVSKDPYKGIVLVDKPGGGKEPGKVTLQFSFHDVFGNNTLLDPSTPLNDLSAEVGYYDELIAVSQWPGLSTHYSVSGPGNPLVQVDLEFQITNYVAGPGVIYPKAVYASSAHLERYRQVWYQVFQEDVFFTLRTSLMQDQNKDKVFSLGKHEALRLVSGICLFLGVAQQLGGASHIIGPGDTLKSIADAYSTTPEIMGSVNSGRQVADIINGTQLVIPYYLTTTQNVGLTSMVAVALSLGAPSGFDPESLIDLNPGLPLQPNVELEVPARTIIVNTQPGDAAENTLAKIARNAYCSTGDLANVNAHPVPSIITSGLSLLINGIALTTEDNDSLQNITARYNTLAPNDPFTVADVAVAIQDVEDLIVENAQLSIDRYLTREGDTFAAITIRFPLYTPGAIVQAPANLVPGLYKAGNPVYVFSKSQHFFSGDTFSTVANSYRITIEELFASNALTPLNSNPAGQLGSNQLSIPGLVEIAETLGKNNYAPYRASAGESLLTIAQKFYGIATDAATLAELNSQIPWNFNEGQSITMSGQTVVIQQDDSFDSIIDAFKKKGVTVSIGQLVSQIKDSTTLIMEGAFFACPLPGTGVSRTLLLLENIFHVPALFIAQANASLKGFLPANGTVVIPQGQITLKPNDTFTSLVSRYKAEQNIETSISEIVTNNAATLILSSNVSFLLPPNNTSYGISLGQGYPDAPSFPSTVFEIKVDLVIARDPQLVTVDFKNEARVISAASIITPKSVSGKSGQLSLVDFAGNFEAAFQNKLKIGVGKTDGLNDESDEPSRHLWGVYFGETGIKSVTIDTTPDFFAIPPLSNKLVSKNGILIQDYVDGQLSGGKEKDFKAVDLEVWGLTILETIDLLLTPAYAAAGYRLSSSDFDMLVGAKKKLAANISKGLNYVLQVTENPDKLEKARQAIKDNLLVNLTKAYDVDSLIQFKATVDAQFPGEDIAPRLNGKAVSKSYITGAVDSPATLATAFSVSKLYVADKLQFLTSILNVGLVVKFPAKPDYTIRVGDTLKTLLLVFNAGSIQQLIASMTWDNPGTSGLFSANRLINIVGLSKVTGTMTLEQLALYFDVDVNEYALANKDTTGIFKLNIDIPYKNKPPVRTTQTNNSLQKIADAFNDPAITPTLLAQELRVNTTVLDPLFVSYVIQFIPDFSMSSSKLSLAKGDNELNFMMSVKTEAAYRKILMNMNYTVNELEFNIANIPDVDGYQVSDWLTFIIPIGSKLNHNDIINTDLGQANIPIPLRSYPQAPVIVSQSGRSSQIAPDPSFPANVENAKKWDFSFSYQHQEAGQDINYIEVFFNQQQNVSLNRPAPREVSPGFFTAMAQFIAVYTPLRDDLSKLLVSPLNQDLSTCYHTFVTLADSIATNWNYGVQAQGGNSVSTIPPESYCYAVQTTEKQVTSGQKVYDKLILTTTQGQPGTSVTFPDMYWMDKGQPQQLLKSVPLGNECVYTYQQDIPAFQTICHQVIFRSLDIIRYQRGLSGAYTKRNLYLTEIPTQLYFVFETPLVVFPNTFVPYLHVNDPLYFRNNEPRLLDALNALFAVLLEGETPDIRITASYGYALAGDTSGTETFGESDHIIVSTLPITYHPLVAYQDPIPGNIDNLITQWRSRNNVSVAHGRYVFDVCVFSALDSNAARPLIELKNLTYRLDNPTLHSSANAPEKPPVFSDNKNPGGSSPEKRKGVANLIQMLRQVVRWFLDLLGKQ